MEIIYYCYAGAHTSVTAASIHIGLLPMDRVPAASEILALPNFDKTPNWDLGKIFKVGEDGAGNNIYIAALGPARGATMSALKLVLAERGLPEDQIIMVDSLKCVSLAVRVGGFISRRIGLVRIGRLMCAGGILARYDCFVEMVKRVKALSTHQP